MREDWRRRSFAGTGEFGRKMRGDDRIRWEEIRRRWWDPQLFPSFGDTWRVEKAEDAIVSIPRLKPSFSHK